MKAAQNLSLLALALLSSSSLGVEPAASPAAAPQIERISDNEYRLGGITFFKNTRTITFPARINQDQDPLEYAIVHESGKDHESLLTTAVSPYHLQVVLLLCGYEPHLGDLFRKEASPDESPPPASRKIQVSVNWTSPDGEKSAPIEDWILDLSTGRPMSRGNWNYTGSTVVDRKLQAEVDGSILAIYLDELALINYPGSKNDDDDNWTPHPSRMPPLSHPVRVTFKPAPQSPPPAK